MRCEDCANSREIRGNRLTARSVSRERGQSGERPEAGVSMRMEDITVLGDTVEVRRHHCSAEDKLPYTSLNPQSNQIKIFFLFKDVEEAQETQETSFEEGGATWYTGEGADCDSPRRGAVQDV